MSDARPCLHDILKRMKTGMTTEADAEAVYQALSTAAGKIAALELQRELLQRQLDSSIRVVPRRLH